LENQEFERRAKHIISRERRCRSAGARTCDLTRSKLLNPKQQHEDGVYIFEHPLHSYKKYVNKYVKHDFEQLKIKYGNNPAEFKK
jgi:hypothetical protein